MSKDVFGPEGHTTFYGWIDTHVHWDAIEFDHDREHALVRAKKAGVFSCLNPSVSVENFEVVRSLAEASTSRTDWPLIFPAYGIHPLYVESAGVDAIRELDMQLLEHRPVAIGEIGLDGYPGAPDPVKQRYWFEAQLALAAQHGLPVLLHLRHAVEPVIQALKRVQGSSSKIPGGIAHAFNGSESQAEQLIRMGIMLGFGGSLTYEGSTRIRRLATRLPLEYIVLETDAPDMVPSWLPKGRNESSELPKIAGVLAALRGVSLEQLLDQTTKNVRRLLPKIATMALNGATAHPDSF